MIKVEYLDVYGWKAAVRGMRNAMNSWDKSDSDCSTIVKLEGGKYIEDFIGENDLDLMRRLVKSGTDHSKFMRFITVTCDITAPLYWWKEYDTYKVGTVANSCSTMHKIHSAPLKLEDFSYEHLTKISSNVLNAVIKAINENRNNFNESKDKGEWWQMIQLLPTSYNQRRTVLLDYQVLRNMYHARRYHKLDEWREFCKVIENLPYSELITMGGE